MIIKFKNWEKYQTRRDIKNPSWFRFEHSIFADPKVCELNPDEFVTFIYLMCEASKNNKNGELYISRVHYRAHCRQPDRVLNRTLNKLQELQIIIQPRVRGMYASVRDPYTTLQDSTEQDITIHKNAQSEIERISFDFEFLYKKYPRKVGKSRGLKICSREIKTVKDYQLLEQAILKYSEHCIKEDSKFIKHFSTFMAEWRDWAEDGVGEVLKLMAPEPDWVKKARQEGV